MHLFSFRRWTSYTTSVALSCRVYVVWWCFRMNGDWWRLYLSHGTMQHWLIYACRICLRDINRSDVRLVCFAPVSNKVNRLSSFSMHLKMNGTIEFAAVEHSTLYHCRSTFVDGAPSALTIMPLKTTLSDRRLIVAFFILLVLVSMSAILTVAIVDRDAWYNDGGTFWVMVCKMEMGAINHMFGDTSWQLRPSRWLLSDVDCCVLLLL